MFSYLKRAAGTHLLSSLDWFSHKAVHISGDQDEMSQKTNRTEQIKWLLFSLYFVSVTLLPSPFYFGKKLFNARYCTRFL